MSNFENMKKNEEYIISLRRHFHENPELSGYEFETMKKIREELDSMGIESVYVEHGGVLGFLHGKNTGRTVLLRSDIDALPVTEKQNLNGTRTCFSKKEGLMHACGHDGHTAMLLGAAKMLSEKKAELEGDVVFCFEEDEETEQTANIKYLFRYMEKNNIKIDACYGCHLYAFLDEGLFGINDSGMMAGITRFDVTIKGRGGHGSRPDQSINPIDCFTAIYTRMASLRMVSVDPFKQLTYSIGKIEGARQANVIPQELTFAGTIRYFDRGVAKTFIEETKKSMENIAAAHNCEIEYNVFDAPNFPILNDKGIADFARAAFGKEFGAENIIQMEPWMASESYAKYLALCPGIYTFIGMRNEEKGVGAAHHNEKFDLNEDVLVSGAAAAVTYAEEMLKGGMEIADSYKAEKFTLKQLLEEIDDTEGLAELYGM